MLHALASRMISPSETLARDAGSTLGSALLDAALEALGRPAFLLGPRGTIQLTNHMGRVLLQHHRGDVLEAIHQSQRSQSDRSPFSIARIEAPDGACYVLAVQNERSPSMSQRLTRAQCNWGLTARHTQVLESIAAGASNKEIAAALRCAESTVENHLTEVFRRSGAKSRADLVGRLFTSTGG